MSGVTVAVINESTVVEDLAVQQVVVALQLQVTRDFGPEWGYGDTTLVFVPRGEDSPPKTWQIPILDDTDQDGALGYHELTDDGLPLGKVFAKTDMDFGLSWSVTASHELLEMLADPWLNFATYRQPGPKQMRIWPREVCDPVEDDQFGYLINNVRVSNFVFQAYFHNTVFPGQKLDFQGVLTGNVPTLAAGGYVSEFDGRNNTGWIQRYGEHTNTDRARLPRPRPRMVRRTQLPSEWRRSTRRAG